MKLIEFKKTIEHTALRPETTASDVKKLCQEAKSAEFYGVCVAPTWISEAKKALSGSACKIVAVVGFPHGNTITASKVYEAEQALSLGASDIDMVLNIGALKSGDFKTAQDDIREVAKRVHFKPGMILKVIIETCLLSDEEKRQACKLSEEAGADFLKTSTGFSTSGATVSDVKLMQGSLNPKTKIKAAGGIRDFATAEAMLKAGASRIGCSASMKILEEGAKVLTNG